MQQTVATRNKHPSRMEEAPRPRHSEEIYAFRAFKFVKLAKPPRKWLTVPSFFF